MFREPLLFDNWFMVKQVGVVLNYIQEIWLIRIIIYGWLECLIAQEILWANIIKVLQIFSKAFLEVLSVILLEFSYHYECIATLFWKSVYVPSNYRLIQFSIEFFYLFCINSWCIYKKNREIYLKLVESKILVLRYFC